MKLENRLILAPFAGLLRLSLRMTYRKLGAAMTYVGVVDARSVAESRDGRMINILGGEEVTNEQERPVCVQLLGADAGYMAEAARRVESSASIIGLNFSGPLSRLREEGYGGAWMLAEPGRIAKIAEAVVSSISVPVTVKMRIGIKGNDVDVAEVAKSIEGAGASGITVHARSASEYYTGPAHWEYIKMVKESVGIPVTGNGGVHSSADAAAMLEQTGCDFVMIGTSGIINPLIFEQTNKLLATGSTAEVNEVIGLLRFFRHYSVYAKTIEGKGLRRFMKHSCRNFLKIRDYMRRIQQGTTTLE